MGGSDRHRVLGLGALAAIALVSAGAVSTTGLWRPGERADAGSGAGASNGAGETRKTETVVRRTLETKEELDGTLGYEGRYVVHNALSGTITALPAEGDVMKRGETLYEVDGRPVRLMYGARPAWRTLRSGAQGADVRQLQANLKALGYGGDLKVDGEFGAKTRAAVKGWQRDAGLDDDGAVDLGEVVFLPGAVRVGEVRATLGSTAQPGTDVLRATSLRKVVTVSLDADRADLLRTGQRVDVELPNGRTTRGTVSKVGTVVEGGGAGDDGEGGGQGDADATIEVTITLRDGSAASRLDGGSVTVSVTRGSRANVLTVPVNALLATLGGGYAVEVVAEDGGTRLVRVEVGLFADGFVEIRSSGVGEGDRVVVPS